MRFSILIICVLIVFSLFENCREQNINSENKKIPKKSQPTIYQSNPFDYVGEDHNTILEYLLNYIEEEEIEVADFYTDRSNFNSQMAEITLIAYQNTGIDTSITYAELLSSYENAPNLYGTSPLNFLATMFYDRFSSYIDTVMLVNASSKDSIWLNNIRNFVYNYDSTEFNYPTENMPIYPPDSFIIGINLLEQQMLLINWEENDTLALKTLVLLKYTANFWFDKLGMEEFCMIENKNQKKGEIVALSKPEFIAQCYSYLKFKLMVTADIIGFATVPYFGPVASSGAAYWAVDKLQKNHVLDDWFGSMWDALYKT